MRRVKPLPAAWSLGPLGWPAPGEEGSSTVGAQNISKQESVSPMEPLPAAPSLGPFSWRAPGEVHVHDDGDVELPEELQLQQVARSLAIGLRDRRRSARWRRRPPYKRLHRARNRAGRPPRPQRGAVQREPDAPRGRGRRRTAAAARRCAMDQTMGKSTAQQHTMSTMCSVSRQVNQDRLAGVFSSCARAAPDVSRAQRPPRGPFKAAQPLRAGCAGCGAGRM